MTTSGFGYIERIEKDGEKLLRCHYDDLNDNRVFHDRYEPEWLEKLESQNKSLSEENARLKGELEVRTHQFDTTYLLKKHLQNQIHKLKEELSITQKAFRECSQSEMSCRESLPLARKKIDELYTEIQNLKEKIDILENNKAHIPELAFRNGKAYCKKCGSDLE